MIRDKAIGAWQTGILIFFLLFANKILILPSLLFNNAKFEGLITPIVLFILELLLLVIFYKLKKRFPHERFFYVLKNHFGKIVTCIVFFLVGIYFLGKMILLYNVTYIFFRNLIYKESNNTLFLICLLPVVNHLAICGVRTIGRTAQIFFPAVVTILIFAVVVGVFGINSSVILEQSNISSIALATIRHVSVFGDLIVLFLFMDKIEVKKGEWKILFSFFSAGALSVFAIILVFFLSYTYTSFLHPFAFFEILSFVKEYGGIGRLDIISMIFIILLTYFQLAIYLKCFFVCFDGLFPKLDRLYSVLTFNFLFVLLIQYAVINLSRIIIYAEEFLPYFSIIAFIIVPVCCLVSLFVRKHEEKRE